MVSRGKSVSAQFLIAFLMVALTLVSYRPDKSQAAPSSNPNKITICHRTHATTNPYRRITVNKTSIFNGDINSVSAGGGGHGQFSHNDWIASDGAVDTSTRPVPNVYNPATTYPNNKKRWGDIIPDVLVNGNNPNRNAAPLNYTLAGLAIYNNQSYLGDASYATMCKRRTAKQYCDDEVPALVLAGRTQSEAESDCMAELEEQGALDDAALKTACGGNISGCTFAQLSYYGVSTDAVTCSAGTVTLKGSANVSTLTAEPEFRYGTTSALGTVVAATPTTVTGVSTFSKAISGLSDGTYYYQAAATTTDADASVMEGSIATFTLTSGSCTSTGATQAMTQDPTGASTTTTVAGTTTTVAGTTTTTVAVATTTTVAGSTTTTTVAGSTTTTTVAVTSTTTASASINSNSTTTSPVQGSFVTTSTSTTSGSGNSGALRGLVWIDKNVNKAKDTNEPGLPLTELTITLKKSFVGGNPGKTIKIKTDSLGKFSVPVIEPGDWTITATLGVSALKKTSDSNDPDGVPSDWQVEVSVPVNSMGIAEFAAAGESVLKMSVEVPEVCVRSEQVEISWAGADLNLGTNDDATFVVDLINQGATVRRIPAGTYSITPLCSSGVKMLGEQLVLQKKQVRAVTIAATVLPATGQRNSRGLIELGALMVLVGFIVAKRRRVIA